MNVLMIFRSARAAPRLEPRAAGAIAISRARCNEPDPARRFSGWRREAVEILVFGHWMRTRRNRKSHAAPVTAREDLTATTYVPAISAQLADPRHEELTLILDEIRRLADDLNE